MPRGLRRGRASGSGFTLPVGRWSIPGWLGRSRRSPPTGPFQENRLQNGAATFGLVAANRVDDDDISLGLGPPQGALSERMAAGSLASPWARSHAPLSLRPLAPCWFRWLEAPSPSRPGTSGSPPSAPPGAGRPGPAGPWRPGCADPPKPSPGDPLHSATGVPAAPPAPLSPPWKGSGVIPAWPGTGPAARPRSNCGCGA